MPRRDYTPRRPKPNLLDLGFERTAEILHSRMQGRRGAFYLYVMASGITYLRAAAERRLYTPPLTAWVGTYKSDTPIELIESDLLYRQREILAARNGEAA